MGHILGDLGILYYYKGDFYKCSTIRNLNCLVYPMPTTISLGVHSVMHLNGDVSFGPNIYKIENHSLIK